MSVYFFLPSLKRVRVYNEGASNKIIDIGYDTDEEDIYQLEDIARQYPVTAPPERVVRVYLQGGYKKIERNVKLTIARRLKAKSTPKTKEQLEADLAKALKNRNKLIAKACRLRQEVADCDEAAAEEEERIQDLRKQLEALENGSNGGGSGSQNNLQHDSRNELSIEGVGPVKHSLNLVEKGAASLCQGADRLFQRVGSAVNRPGVGGVGIPGAVFKPSLIRAY